jgi:hypothetical protein
MPQITQPAHFDEGWRLVQAPVGSGKDFQYTRATSDWNEVQSCACPNRRLRQSKNACTLGERFTCQIASNFDVEPVTGRAAAPELSVVHAG